MPYVSQGDLNLSNVLMGGYMKHKVFILSLLVLTVPLFSSCAALLIGGVAGYEVSADSVKADVDVSYNRAYDGSLETIRAMGGLSTDMKEEGWVKSDKDGYNVAVHVTKVTEKVTRITVSARKMAMPKPQYARDVLVKILKRVKDQPFWLR
jgi:hypothetical protein